MRAWIRVILLLSLFPHTRLTRAETYVTLENVSIDRCVSAWFIQRFVDDQAKFVFFKNGEPPPEGIGYDYYGAPFFRRGPNSTFTSLVKANQRESDQALRQIHEDANDVSAWKKGPESLTTKLLNLIAELRESASDETVYRQIFPLFDLLYLSHGGNESSCLPSQRSLVESAPATILEALRTQGTIFPLSHNPPQRAGTFAHASAMQELNKYIGRPQPQPNSAPELQRQVLAIILNRIEPDRAGSDPSSAQP